MNISNRRRLLALARFLERWAKGLRKYVARVTPRRGAAVLRNEMRARRAEDHLDDMAEQRRVRGEEA